MAKNAPGLPDPAEVHRHQHQDGDRGGQGFVALEERQHRLRVLHPRRDRDRDGEHVVDQQRARHGQARVASQIHRGDLVVAATRRVGMDVLPVGGHHHQHHDGDQECDLPGKGVRGQSGQRQGEQDLVGRVGHRGQRVGREHRKRDPLRQQGLTQLSAAQLTAHQQTFAHVRQAHNSPAYRRRQPPSVPHAGGQPGLRLPRVAAVVDAPGGRRAALERAVTGGG